MQGCWRHTLLKALYTIKIYDYSEASETYRNYIEILRYFTLKLRYFTIYFAWLLMEWCVMFQFLKKWLVNQKEDSWQLQLIHTYWKCKHDCRLNCQEVQSRQLQALIIHDVYIGVIYNHDISTASKMCGSVIFPLVNTSTNVTNSNTLQKKKHFADFNYNRMAATMINVCMQY